LAQGQDYFGLRMLGRVCLNCPIRFVLHSFSEIHLEHFIHENDHFHLQHFLLVNIYFLSHFLQESSGIFHLDLSPPVDGNTSFVGDRLPGVSLSGEYVQFLEHC
jgi:hypothetical protein